MRPGEPSSGGAAGSLAKDFLTGCGTLVGLGLILFVVVPVVVAVAEESLRTALPVALYGLVIVGALGLAILLIAGFGPA